MAKIFQQVQIYCSCCRAQAYTGAKFSKAEESFAQHLQRVQAQRREAEFRV